MFGRKESIAILISILIISFVFGFNDNSPGFDTNYWIMNFLRVLLIVTISLLLKETVIKSVAKRIGCESEYSIWNLRRYGFKEKEILEKGVPVASVLAILIALIFNGKVFFTAIGNNIIKANRELRIGRKFTRLDAYSEGLIIISGILVTAFLTIFFSFLDKISWVDFGLIITINFWLTLWSLVPIPPLNAGRLFIGSRIRYVFTLGLVIVMFLLKDVNILLNLALSLISAGLIMAIYYYLVEY